MSFDLKSYLETYNPHRETVEYLKAKSEEKPTGNYVVETLREASRKNSQQYGGHVEFNGTEKELFIPPSSNTDTIPVTIYHPKNDDSNCSTLPVVVYFHGGGNVTKSRKTNENVCKLLVRDKPCIVVSVEYRLAPEHKFPASNDDAKRAVEWVAENKQKFGGTSSSKIGVVGDSAGGRLAAVVCHDASSLIDFAVLVYPVVNYTKVFKSMEEFKFGPLLSKRITDWYAEQYVEVREKILPRASVILNTDFSYLPPTLIIVAEHDLLRDGCYEYYDKLKAAGVPVQLELIKGVPHAFWSMPGAFKQNCQAANAFITDFIKRCAS